jgi:ABC-type branched-subunit amino acid transport system ATPase component
MCVLQGLDPDIRPVVRMTAALAVRDIHFSYGACQVLFGISFEVAPGESLALVGTNGAGKSTLLRAVAGLDPPSSGTVLLDGRDVTGQLAERLAFLGLALIQGGRAVFPDLSVADNLEIQALTLRRRGRSWLERREQTLDAFPALRRRWSHLAGTLSGGEQQQLALAKALLLRPRVLCIDELSLGLAPVVVDALMDVLRSVQYDGAAIVLVEQSLNIATQLCQRAVFLEKGEVRFEGQAADLLHRHDLARAVFLGQSGNGSSRRAARRRAAPTG